MVEYTAKHAVNLLRDQNVVRVNEIVIIGQTSYYIFRLFSRFNKVMCVVSSKHKNICLVMRELYGLDNGIHYKFYGLYLCVFEHAIIVVLDIMSTRYWPFVALVKHTRLHDSRYT